LKVDIDSHEKERAGRAETAFNKAGCETSIKELIVGDYLFDGEVVFEYKTYPDAFSSIMDGRLKNQAIEQKEKYKWHFVIIVGTDGDKTKALTNLYYNKVRFSISQYEGMVDSLNTFTTVIFAPTEAKAFARMKSQAEKCLDERPLMKKTPKKTANPVYNRLMQIHGLNHKKVSAIIKKLKLKSYRDLDNTTHADLCSVEGIAGKTADNIIKAIKGDLK